MIVKFVFVYSRILVQPGVRVHAQLHCAEPGARDRKCDSEDL